VLFTCISPRSAMKCSAGSKNVFTTRAPRDARLLIGTYKRRFQKIRINEVCTCISLAKLSLCCYFKYTVLMTILVLQRKNVIIIAF
jgi:hypothetical protein